MEDLLPPPAPVAPAESLFMGEAWYKIQSLAERHEYKKCAGSSDAAMTYDTTAV